MTSLESDHRWLKLHDPNWICPVCGEKHNGVFELTSRYPDYWQGNPEPQDNSEILNSTNVLTEDFCITEGAYFFVRSMLEFPIIGTNERFAFNVWASLSKENFDTYVETFDEGQQGDLGPWFGWFSNRLRGYPDTINMKCYIHPQNERVRPLIELEPSGHPVSVAQRQGITFDTLLEIYAQHGHDIRPGLE